MSQHVYVRIYGICIYGIHVYICSDYPMWLCVDTPLAADINIDICVASISPGALFRDQISRMTRDLSRYEHVCTRGNINTYTFTSLYYKRYFVNERAIKSHKFFPINVSCCDNFSIRNITNAWYFLLLRNCYSYSNLTTKLTTVRFWLAWIFLRISVTQRARKNKQSKTDDVANAIGSKWRDW